MRGVKVNDYPAPEKAGCDFCGQTFGPVAWNQRTCVRCAVAGAPDQSQMLWTDYQRCAADFSREQGRRAKLTGAAAAKRADSIGRKFAGARGGSKMYRTRSGS